MRPARQRQWRLGGRGDPAAVGFGFVAVNGDVVAGSSGRTATVRCLSGECPFITTRIVRVRPPTVDCLVTGDSSDTLSVLHHGVSNTFPYRAVAA